MKLRKWNYQTREYDDFESPATNTTLYSTDMDEPVDCAQCGKGMTFGEGYTSMEVHNSHGLGFPVCHECYGLELQRRTAAEFGHANQPDISL